MYNRKKSCEVPVQDFSRIQLMFLPNAHSKGKLFTDYTFPPDKSSLTYVYSGDDRYEQMIFKRPKEICTDAVFTGVGGVYTTPFPAKNWKKCRWFEAAIAVVSLNFRQMDQLIPGYRSFDQSLQTDYIGCFCFKLWRFGQWVDVVVDDHLPTMNNTLLYCDAYGDPREFWGPLVEKAYAKCKKTYEANECGRTLDALTDLTGGICEFYTPDINPPENLFHLMYKSGVNRSQIVCWRNDKLLTPTGFLYSSSDSDMMDHIQDGRSKDRYLHTVTATTKFPLSDGRIIEMVRLHCPYKTEPVWNGKFAEQDMLSWGTVNTEFIAKYKPLNNQDQNEYWMTLQDFRCNFGGMIICSTETPYTTEYIGLDRCYRRLSEGELRESGHQSLFTTKERRRSSEGKRGRHTTSSYFSFPMNSHPLGYSHRRKHRTYRSKSAQSEQGIMVRENPRTVKVDNTLSKQTNGVDISVKIASATKREKKHTQDCSALLQTKSGDTDRKQRDQQGSPVSYLRKLHLHTERLSRSNSPNQESATNGRPMTRVGNCIPIVNVKPESHNEDKRNNCDHRKTDTNNVVASSKQTDEMFYTQNRSGSIVSNSSGISECQSTFSASDISLNLQGCLSRDNSFKRPKSAPGPCTIVRNVSSGSLPNMTVSNFMATSPDNFRSHGSWRAVLEYMGSWEKSESGVSSIDMKLHPRNPRILLTIIHPDAVNQIVAPNYLGKSHVIISLLQDYRHGALTANSLLVPIGFSVYKTKNPGRDEKRTITKLCLAGETTPNNDSREVTCRFDLVPGSYFIVPYCLSENHCGQFLVRVLSERDPVAGKTGCIVS